jgi:hypothetical protein
MQRILVIGVLSLVFLLADVTAQAGVEEIRALYQEINALTQGNAGKQVSLYAASEQDRIEWRTVVSGIEQGEFNKSDFRAQVYLHENKIVKARIETTSASGDWKLTEEYYFYKNGRTAFYFRSLLTFQGYDFEHDRDLPPGPYIVEERRYYDEAGKQIRHLENAFVQATKKEVPVKYIRTNLPVELYQNTKSLPFYHAISGPHKKS